MTDEKDLEMSPDSEDPKGSEAVDESSGEEAQAETPEADGPDSGASAEASESESSEPAVDVMEDSAGAKDDKVVNESDESEDNAEAAMLAMLEELPEESSSAKAEDINFGEPSSVADAEFQQLSEPAGSADKGSIDLLMDVDLPVAIELGRTDMTINDILALGPGSVVELNKLAGEPVDLLVNSKVVARGEVVVVDENFGLRVTHLLTPEERLKSLAEA